MLKQITGTGHGIGKELAIGYASLGATVVCWDVNKETNEQTMNEIIKMGRTSVYAYQYVSLIKYMRIRNNLPLLSNLPIYRVYHITFFILFVI